MLLIILHVPPSVGRGNCLVSFPTELQYLVFTLIFQVSARTLYNSTVLRNFSYHIFFSEIFMLCLLQNWVYAGGRDSYRLSRCHSSSKVHCSRGWIYYRLLLDRIV